MAISMKPNLIAAGLASLFFFSLAPLSFTQRVCPVRVEAEVEVAAGEFSVADLLTPETCPALRSAATSLRLGQAPLAGSVRVLDGSEVRNLLRRLSLSVRRDMQPGSGADAQPALRVPPRISVRLAGARASCDDIARRILAGRRAGPPDSATASGAGRPLPAAAAFPHATECGAAGRIPRDAPLELTRTVWNPAQGSWEVSARCLRSADCVPFLVRFRNNDEENDDRENRDWENKDRKSNDGKDNDWKPQTRNHAGNFALSPASLKPLVRPGQTVTLLWDQAGIRLIVPAVCLDPGGAGDAVRTRIVGGGRLVRGIVESAGQVRAAS
jgi:hypothetical protein